MSMYTISTDVLACSGKCKFAQSKLLLIVALDSYSFGRAVVGAAAAEVVCPTAAIASSAQRK